MTSRDESKPSDREDLKVQLLLGSMILGSLSWSVLSYFHPFG